MKTIFITSFHAHISRNILATDVVPLLKKMGNLRAVILVPKYKIDYFKKNFGGENIIVDGIDLYQSSRKKSGLFFKRLSMMLLDTDTKRYKHRYKFYRDKKKLYFALAMLTGFLGRSFALRKLIRFLDLQLSPNGLFDDLILKYKPDAVVSTDIQNENDVALMQDAKRRSITVLGMFRSWDNPTQYAIRIFPDKLLVGSQAIAEGAAKYQGYPLNRIIITGQPHYDRYLKGPSMAKEQFFSKFNLNPKKRLILFAPLGDKFIEENDLDSYVMKILGGVDAQVLVRFPPDEKVTVMDFEKPKNMEFHFPGKIFFKKEYNDREIGREDDLALIDSIYYSDLVVTGPTSILLDSAFFDKPVIAVNIAPTERNFFDKVYCYKFSHIKKIMETRGICYIETKSEFLIAIQNYLKDPSRDKNGRKKIRDLWFSHADGGAGKRLVNEIINFIN